MGVLTEKELQYLQDRLGRLANEVEQDIVGAEWSEHCSYKSSKKLLRLLPTEGKRVVVGPGYDAGVLDIGDGYVLTVHIESHNHPSAVEPFGGAATGVGGVIRDIMSMGTRPIAVLDALRFSNVTGRTKSAAKSRWLLKNVVKGIADYGNCIGIPTVGGEIEFDPSFEDYCLVDVASLGLGRRDEVIANTAVPGDIIVLAGGSTGRDGIHGASFASKTLDSENRSAVQIPDPFLEKLLLEATMEAAAQGCVKSIKDLGGGGLSCCLSETSDSLGLGFDVELDRVHAREAGMSSSELMISESQERMLYVTDETRLPTLESIFKKYEVPYSIIGSVKDHSKMVVSRDDKVVSDMPSSLVAHAPLIDWPAVKPRYMANKPPRRPAAPKDIGKALLDLLSVPSIASKRWVYQQYDHEVGLRTISKPGSADAALLRLDRDDKLVAIKLDGNSKQCYLDPYLGTLGVLSEGRRNVICAGAEPIGVVDHLQFASPQDPEVFWTFKEAIRAIVEYCTKMEIPVIGGKVSFYNETPKGAIKPTPVIGTLGLVDGTRYLGRTGLSGGEAIFVVGSTLPEMGGSEYYESIQGITGGVVPGLDMASDKRNGDAVLAAIRDGIVSCCHDCSKGGLAVALAEMAILGKVGAKIDLSSVPSDGCRMNELMFSESNSRYLIGTARPDELSRDLAKAGVSFAQIGIAGGPEISYAKGAKSVASVALSKAMDRYYSLDKLMG